MDKNNNNNNSINNIHLIELNQYERPTITEERNREWIGIGENNDYYQALIDAYMDSTTNNAVINGIVDRIYGKGLEATDSARKPDMYAMMRSLLKKKDVRRVCQDLKLLGEGAFQVTYSGGQIKSITHFPRETLRAEKQFEEADKIRDIVNEAGQLLVGYRNAVSLEKEVAQADAVADAAELEESNDEV